MVEAQRGRLFYSVLAAICLSVYACVYYVYEACYYLNNQVTIMIDLALIYLAMLQTGNGLLFLITLVMLFFAVLSRNVFFLRVSIVCQVIIAFYCCVFLAPVYFSLSHSAVATDESMLNNTMKGYALDTAMAKKMDFLQEKLKCCGVKGYQDWKDIKNAYLPIAFATGHGRVARVPASCAIITDLNCSDREGSGKCETEIEIDNLLDERDVEVARVSMANEAIHKSITKIHTHGCLEKVSDMKKNTIMKLRANDMVMFSMEITLGAITIFFFFHVKKLFLDALDRDSMAFHIA